MFYYRNKSDMLVSLDSSELCLGNCVMDYGERGQSPVCCHAGPQYIRDHSKRQWMTPEIPGQLSPLPQSIQTMVAIYRMCGLSATEILEAGCPRPENSLGFTVFCKNTILTVPYLVSWLRKPMNNNESLIFMT